MTTRPPPTSHRERLPHQKHSNRPNSAVFIGTGSNPLRSTFPSGSSSGSSSPTKSSSILSTPPAIPDLPEPPSPVPSSPRSVASVESRESGLPSPPATNSTGSASGSQGDFNSIAYRPGRQSGKGLLDARSDNEKMLNEDNIKTFHEAFSNASSDSSTPSSSTHHDHDSYRDDANDYSHEYDEPDDYEDNENEDDTARLDRRIDNLYGQNSENAAALERVKSLTQRNRAALDKLSSYSRFSSPSPNPSTQSSRTFTSPNSTSHFPTKLRHSESSTHLSGSETEREEDKDGSLFPNSNSNSSHGSSKSPGRSRASNSSSTLLNRSITPISRGSDASSQRRPRLISAPASPGKALRTAMSQPSTDLHRSSTTLSRRSDNMSSPSKRQSKRVSIAMSDTHILSAGQDSDEDQDYDANSTSSSSRRVYGGRDVAQAALDALSRSRDSPIGNVGKRRQPLPREFRDSPTNSGADNNGRTSAAGTGILRRGSINGGGSYLNSSDNSDAPLQRTRHSTSSTLSSMTESNRDSPRWMSEDFTSTSKVEDGTRQGRRQSLRGGSAESALGADGSRVAGLGLRAAGLSRRGTVTSLSTISRDQRDARDVFNEDRDRSIKPPARAATSLAEYGGSRAQTYSNHVDFDDTQEITRRGDGRDDDKSEPQTAPPNLRTYKSAYQLSAPSHDRPGSVVSRYSTSPVGPATARPGNVTENGRDSPYGSVRRSAVNPSRQSQSPHPTTSPRKHARHSTEPILHLSRDDDPEIVQSEHARLMMESLTTFESQLARISQFHNSSSSARTAGEMLRNAQGAVYACERLNALLKVGSNRALEEQIESEVNAPLRHHDSDTRSADPDPAEIWRKVGGEFREGLRVSDDLVRSVTGLLLGVGRAVRELSIASSSVPTVSPGSSSGGSATSREESLQHNRSISLDEEGLRLSRRLAGDRYRATPEPGSTSSGESRHPQRTSSRLSWEYREREKGREDALRRLSGRDSALGDALPRPDSVVKGSLPITARTATPNGYSSLTISSSMRRIPTLSTYTPPTTRDRDKASSSKMATADSQETVHGYEPSPTPASRTRTSVESKQVDERNTTLGKNNKTAPPLTIPKPIPTLPSENRKLQSSAASNNKPAPANEKIKPASERIKRDARRISISTTVRGPVFSNLTSTSGAGTAITPHTVSGSPGEERHAFPTARRTNSNRSATSGTASGNERERNVRKETLDSPVTFSRSRAGSAIQSLRSRTISSSRGAGDESGRDEEYDGEDRKRSSDERERERPRISLDSRSVRVSLDGATAGGSGTASKDSAKPAHAADRSAASILKPSPSGGAVGKEREKERRRTVVDVWPPR